MSDSLLAFERPVPRFRLDGLYRIAIEAMPYGVTLLDPNGTIVFVNSEFERQFGYVKDDLVGQDVDALPPALLHKSRSLQLQRPPSCDADTPTTCGTRLYPTTV